MYNGYVMKMAFNLYGLPLKNALTSLTMRKTSEKFPLGNFYKISDQHYHMFGVIKKGKSEKQSQRIGPKETWPLTII